MRIKGKRMTLQNADTSARLWNPCAKDGERLFRQGASCPQAPGTSNPGLSGPRKRAGHFDEKDELWPSCHSTWELPSRVLALWVNRATSCGVLTTGNALVVPTFLDFLQGHETASSTAGPECWSEDTTSPTAGDSLCRSPSSPGGQGH